MGYKYYVYIAPGHIEYGDDFDEMQEIAKKYDSVVKEC